MCGIVGILGGAASADRVDLGDLVSRMTAALHHRGPDSGGTWIDRDARIAFGHRRLAIVDLSAAGAQPMHSRCGRFVLTYNGEIYNVAAVRAELLAYGAVFRGNSDTEVLLEALVAWGIEKALARVNGMFAFGFWDKRERCLFLARDRFGEKPLYFGFHQGLFLFCSELKALREWDEFRPAIDKHAVAIYLRFNYLPDPYCILEGMRKLQPGCWVRVDSKSAGTNPRQIPFWSARETAEAARRARFNGTVDEAIDLVDGKMREAVRSRMFADVPLGAFLSGGIDSSLIVALMQSQSPRRIRTFSIGFDVGDYDEAPEAKAVAQLLGAEHVEMYVSSEDAIGVVPSLSEVYDEPFADASQIPTLLVSKLGRQSVKVAMSGDGGDEVFGGYLRYTRAVDAWRRSRWVPAPLRKAMAKWVLTQSSRRLDSIVHPMEAVLPPRFRTRMPGEKLQKFARTVLSDDMSGMYRSIVSQWQEPSLLVEGAFEPETIGDLDAEPGDCAGAIEKMMILDTLHYLPGDILTKIDRASMSYGLEVRVPFLDPSVFSVAWSLPLEWKLRGGVGKWILRRVLERYLPSTVFERPKSGFAVPIDQWLRGSLRDWAEELLDQGRLRQNPHLDHDQIHQVWSMHLSGQRNCQYPLWGVLMFEQWRRQWAAA